MYSHLKFECGREDQFNCSHCPFKTKFKQNINRHFARQHGKGCKVTSESQDLEKKKFNCTVCSRSYSHWRSLYNHQKFECGKEARFFCSICSYKTKVKQNFNRHLKQRHNEVRNLTAQPFEQLEVKMSVSEKEIYICEICSKVYTNLSSFYSHQKFECGKGSEYLCSQCPYLTKRKSNLKRHFAKQH